jgi:hypothetical protein
MTERDVLLQQLNEYSLTLEGMRRHGETPTRVIARQLSHIEEQVLRIQTQLNLIDLELGHPRKQQGKGESSYWARLNPWHAEFSIWSYVSLLSGFMVIAFAVQMIWA